MREVILSHDEDKRGFWTTTVYVHRNGLGTPTTITSEHNKSFFAGRHKIQDILRVRYKKPVTVIDEIVSEYKYIQE